MKKMISLLAVAMFAVVFASACGGDKCNEHKDANACTTDAKCDWIEDKPALTTGTATAAAIFKCVEKKANTNNPPAWKAHADSAAECSAFDAKKDDCNAFVITKGGKGVDKCLYDDNAKKCVPAKL